jgi:3-hydroxyacyl-CoA dehydrogenase/3a,7a,12a-trihydroxy-5b-cholest-24-enoyl-CoA hydratase
MSQSVAQSSVHERWMQVQEREAAQSDPRSWSYSELDAIRYALSVGAGATDLPWVYERHPGGLRVLPTLAIMPTVGAWDWLAQTLQLADDEIVLGEQSLALAGALPPALTTRYRHRIDGLHDKGASAMAQVSTVVEADGEVLATGISRFFVRAAGGFGGGRGPAGLLSLSTQGDAGEETRWSAPAEAPLLYRLSGDLHPIHVEAKVARAAGQPRPPLHGMYLLGRLCQEIVCRRGRDVRAALIRYQGSAYPQEALLTRWWWDDATIHGTVEATDRGAAVCKTAFAVG